VKAGALVASGALVGSMAAGVAADWQAANNMLKTLITATNKNNFRFFTISSFGNLRAYAPGSGSFAGLKMGSPILQDHFYRNRLAG
jgi:hypothetical protein